MFDIEIPFYVSYAALWALAVFQGLVIIGLVRTVASGSAQSSAPRRNGRDLTGHMLPDFTAHDLKGETFDSRVIAGRPAALLFVSAECSTCAVTLNEFQALNAKMENNVVVFCRSTHAGCVKLADKYQLGSAVIEDTDGVVGDLLWVEITPTAILIDADGVIASYGHPMTPEELDDQVGALRQDAEGVGADHTSVEFHVTQHGGDPGTAAADVTPGSRATAGLVTEQSADISAK